MATRRQKFAARLVLLLLAVAGGVWLFSLDYGRKISTDVLDLVPGDERSPELALVRQMAGERVTRVVLLALQFAEGVEPAAEERAATTFIKSLEHSPAFAEVVRLGGTASFESVGAYLVSRRFDLLLPQQLLSRKAEYEAAAHKEPFADWLAEKTAGDLSAYLATPEAMAFQDLLPSDPLLLVPHALAPWQAFAGAAGASSRRQVLIWALTTDSPLKASGQRPVFLAVGEAETAAMKEAAFALRWTGIGRFAAASRQRIEHELSGLNLLSLIAVLAIGFAGVRRPVKTLHLIPVLLFALLGAWVATTAYFPRVHVLVFVVGSLLGGVAVDYGFYLFLQPPCVPDESPLNKVSRLLRPLLASALTTVIGFSLLLLSDLPMIRQLGVFVSAGLLSALAAALLWFVQSGDTCWETRAFARARLPASGRRVVRMAVVGVAAVSICWGLTRLTWCDDIRQLDIPSPELRANDAEVRRLFGESDDQTIFLTRGATAAEARTALRDFQVWHRGAFPQSATASLGLLLPAPGDWARFPGVLAELDGFEGALRLALARHGFEPEGFGPFYEAWGVLKSRRSKPEYDELVQGLASAVHGPLGLMMDAGPGASWFATLADHAPAAEPPRSLSTVSSAQLESLNRLFARYRVSALRLSSVGLALVGLSVLVLYGPRRGWRIFALPVGSCLVAFGLLGIAGQPLNLFHLLGAFLGVCLSHNYAIFSAENMARGEAPPPSIRLSALTTAASFGVLALSSIPVIVALGTMVAIIVLAALVAVELDLLTERGQEGDSVTQAESGAPK